MAENITDMLSGTEMTYAQISAMDREHRLLVLVQDLEKRYGSVEAFIELSKKERENMKKLSDYAQETIPESAEEN